MSATLAPTTRSQGVMETVLENGLKVLIQEVRSAPVVSFMVWYKVGSRNESTGQTGISHLLEHMMFKGTKNYGLGEISRTLFVNGAEVGRYGLAGVITPDHTIRIKNWPLLVPAPEVGKLTDFRVAVEQASTFGWARYTGMDGAILGMKTFGASAPLKVLQKEFGFTTNHVVEAAKAQLARGK